MKKNVVHKRNGTKVYVVFGVQENYSLIDNIVGLQEPVSSMGEPNYNLLKT